MLYMFSVVNVPDPMFPVA